MERHGAPSPGGGFFAVPSRRGSADRRRGPRAVFASGPWRIGPVDAREEQQKQQQNSAGARERADEGQSLKKKGRFIQTVRFFSCPALPFHHSAHWSSPLRAFQKKKYQTRIRPSATTAARARCQTVGHPQASGCARYRRYTYVLQHTVQKRDRLPSAVYSRVAPVHMCCPYRTHTHTYQSVCVPFFKDTPSLFQCCLVNTASNTLALASAANVTVLSRGIPNSLHIILSARLHRLLHLSLSLD